MTEKVEVQAKREESKMQAFDTQLFGLLLRRKRVNAGYSTAQAFSDNLELIWGVKIPRDTIYRIESGKVQPSIEQALAFSLALKHESAGPGLLGGIDAEVRLALDKSLVRELDDQDT